jgi:hypothetical protein
MATVSRIAAPAAYATRRPSPSPTAATTTTMTTAASQKARV